MNTPLSSTAHDRSSVLEYQLLSQELEVALIKAHLASWMDAG